MSHLIPFLLDLENPALQILKATRDWKSPSRSWRPYIGNSNICRALSIPVGMILGEYGWKSGLSGFIAALKTKDQFDGC